jgi:FkbM family methyltransferase
MLLRSLAERLSRNVVLRRRLPLDLGGRIIYVTPDSALRYWRWNLEKFDPELLGIVRTFVPPNSVVWDIGANVGLFSFSCAARARMVLAIEPDSWLSSLLVRSAVQNENVHVLAAAVDQSVGLVELNIAARGRSANFVRDFGTEQGGGARFRQTVISVTLDWLSERFPLPDVLKIDVEGMEGKVLAGGQQLFKRSKPIIISEVLPQNIVWVTELLTATGYRLYDKSMNPIKRAGATTVAIPSDGYNTLLNKLVTGDKSSFVRSI